MAGYWPSSFFACLWTETKSRSINSQKRTRPISSHLDQTNLVNKGFVIGLLVKFCLRDAAGSPEGARWLHLARSGSQSQRAIWFIFPAHGASHVIRRLNVATCLATELNLLRSNKILLLRLLLANIRHVGSIRFLGNLGKMSENNL